MKGAKETWRGVVWDALPLMAAQCRGRRWNGDEVSTSATSGVPVLTAWFSQVFCSYVSNCVAFRQYVLKYESTQE